MATKEFILQGFTKRTHADAVRELFNIPDIERVLISVAFVTESGVEQLAAAIKANAARTVAFTGIRNDITSCQGLRLLRGITNHLYTVDTGSRTVVFHPKLYLVRSAAQARLIVGSANLTLGGLNNNIEAGMILGFDLTDPKDKSVIDEIEAQFSSLPKAYPEHVVKIESDDELGELLASGRLVDEMAVMPPRPTISIGEFGAADTVPRIKLKITPLKRALSKTKAAPQSIQSPEASGVDLELVWESKPLTRRDLTIPDGKKTNATGSVNLDKGLLPEEVDHRHYFRDEVFPHLKWATRSKTVDEAFAKFQLIRKGISCGEFDLAIRHTTSTTSKAYEQRNAMTRLSWGTMRSYIARPDLIGRTIAIYRDNADATRFVLEID